MATITISMSDAAFDIVRAWPKGQKSQRISAAIQLWQFQNDEWLKEREARHESMARQEDIQEGEE